MFMQKEPTRKTLPTLLLGVVVGAGVVVPATGKAWYQRYHASACMPVDFTAAYRLRTEPHGNGTGHAYYEDATQGTGGMGLICPVVATDREPYGPATLLNVAVYDASSGPVGSIWAYACVKFAGATGGACGAPAQSNGSAIGVQTLQPERSKWAAHPFDYAYVHVILGGSNTLYGYSIAG
jgi:hypothetical protein